MKKLLIFNTDNHVTYEEALADGAVTQQGMDECPMENQYYAEGLHDALMGAGKCLNNDPNILQGGVFSEDENRFITLSELAGFEQ